MPASIIRHRHWLLAIACIALGFVLTAAPADDAAAPASYMRVVDADENVIRLDMAVRLFTPAKGTGPTVALVGAIHIADAKFYELAQQFLDAQDLVLYEGVGAGHERGDETPAARIETTREHLRAVAIMLERYKALKGEYPASLSALIKIVREYDKLKGLRLERVAKDAWGRPLRYERKEKDKDKENGKGFTLTSLGADGKPGGTGGAGGAGGVEENADLNFADQPALKQAEIDTSGGRGGIQNDLAEALGLTFQLNVVDTGKRNYRNADLTIEQLAARVKEAGGDLKPLLGMMDGSSVFAGILKIGLGLIKGNPQWQATVKVLLSEMLREVGEDITKIKSVPKSMQALLKTLIDDRNQAVIDELKKELAKEKRAGTIAVWYGSGHMKDLERRLVEQLHYKPAGEFWLPAISTDLSATGMSREEFNRLRGMMQKMMGGMK